MSYFTSGTVLNPYNGMNRSPRPVPGAESHLLCQCHGEWWQSDLGVTSREAVAAWPHRKLKAAAMYHPVKKCCEILTTGMALPEILLQVISHILDIAFLYLPVTIKE